MPPERVFPLGELSTEIGALVEPIAVGYHAVKRSGGSRPRAVVRVTFPALLQDS